MDDPDVDTEDEVMEDSGDDDRGVIDNGKLLDRLFDEALLPKYAFPTDVATFSVFEEGTDPWNPKRRYSPQQSLNAALSQYAPGHEVWVDGKRYISLGLYAEHEADRLQAYQDRRLYFQCRVCAVRRPPRPGPRSIILIRRAIVPPAVGARRSGLRGVGFGLPAFLIRQA